MKLEEEAKKHPQGRAEAVTRSALLFMAVSGILSILIFFAGCAVLLGWALDIQRLKSISPNFVSMKANTALCFAFLGFSLWSFQSKRRGHPFFPRLGLICSLAVFGIGLLTLSEYLFGWNPGIDQLLFKEPPGAILTSSPGRMAFNTAINFTFTGLALSLFAFPKKGWWLVAQSLMILEGLLSLMASVGYLYHADPLILGPYLSTAMALHTAALFLLVFFGTFFCWPGRGIMAIVSSDDFGGKMVRRLFPVTISVPILLGWIKLHSEYSGVMPNEFGVSFVATGNLVITTTFVLLLSSWLSRTDSERKRAETALMASAKNWRDTFDAMTDVVWLLGPDHRILQSNRAVQSIFHLKPQEVVGRFCHEIVHGMNEPHPECPVSQMRKSGRRESMELFFDERWFLVTADPMLGPDGSLMGIVHVVSDITERKKAEDALRSKTALLEAQVTANLDGILIVNEKQKRILMNHRITELFNVPESILEDENDAPLLKHVVSLTKYPERFLGKIDYLWAHPDEVSYDEIEFKNGMILERYSAPIWGKGGENYGRIWTFHDVTERKRAEEMLETERKRMEVILSVQNTGLSVINPDMTIAWVNPKTREMFPGKEPVGQKCHVFYESRTTVCDGCGTLRTFMEGKVCESEQLVPATGRWYSIVSQPIKDTAGRVVSVLEAITDITERKKAEAETLKAKQFSESVIDSLPGIFYVYDDKRKFLRINDNFLKVSGYSQEEVLRMHPLDFFPVYEKKRLEEKIAEVFEKGEAFIEADFLSKDGKKTPHHFTGYRAMIDNAPLLVGVGVDITARMKAEEEIWKLNLELEERVKQRTSDLAVALKELESFSYSVAHDLKAPLRAMAGFASILFEDYAPKLDENARRVIGVIKNNAKNMGEMIDALLNLSHVGRVAMNCVDTDVTKLVRSVCHEFKNAFFKDRAIDLDLKPLPSVRADPVLLRQIFTNLIFNAMKFTARKEKTVIEIGGYDKDGEHVYYVKDNGVGFDMKYKDKLFETFQRLHTKEKFEGTGIGLAIVKSAVQRHGGRVWAEAEAGQGATFCFTLP